MAKFNDYLVVSKDGKIVKIPARELLKKRMEKIFY
jgi:hypothetical protein